MLKPLPFEGTVKVINKGTDAVIVAGRPERDAALQAAKVCGVRGISTAVLEIPETEDAYSRTFQYYSELAGVYVFSDRELYERCRTLLSASDRVGIAEHKDTESFERAVLAARKIQEREKEKC